MLVLAGGQVWAQQIPQDALKQKAPDAPSATVVDGSTANSADTMTVIGTVQEEKKTSITVGASKEDIERRDASHMSDLIDEISGTSVNSPYARPEISVGVQGVAGHGRVSQSLEGITQNFHAFNRDIGQTGSIFVEPQFLKSIDITRGVQTRTGSLGSLGGSVDFKYLDLEDILLPGKGFGGMLRGSTGFSKYKNGQKPSGSFFLGARNEHWDVMAGASDSRNGAYRIGSHFNKGKMLHDFNSTFFEFYGSGSYISSYDHCRYSGIVGITGASVGRDGFANCQFTPEKLTRFKEAAKSGPLTGTEKNADSQMLRLRYFFNDDYNQSLAFFATDSHAKYQTDQEPKIRVPPEGQPGTASWGENPWFINTALDNRVFSLKYKADFSDYFNPEVLVYHEQQKRQQRWKGVPGSYAVGEDLHYTVENKSTGLTLSNASHFSAPVVGLLRFDAAVDLRRADKEVDDFTEEDFHKKRQQSMGIDYVAQEWDVNSRNDTQGITLNLSTEDGSPWQASAGVGWQRVKMDIDSPRFLSGNIAREATILSARYRYLHYRKLGYSSREARKMAKEAGKEALAALKFDPNYGYQRFVSDDQTHRFNLKSANLHLQYTPMGSGLTTEASIGYSERAPTSNEMYTSGAWNKQVFAANPDLEPEKNLSLQLGVTYQQAALLATADELNVSVGYYHNRIKDYIGYGPIWMTNELRDTGINMDTRLGSVANVNNLNTVVRHGFELNLAYRQPLFYVRGNLTVPLRHDNKMCSWLSPSGSHYEVYEEGKYDIYKRVKTKGPRPCYSGWNWMETGSIDPLRGSLTAALTPYGEKLEIGSTLHFRGKQRAAYYYVEEAQFPQAMEGAYGTKPKGNGWIEADLWPKTIKVDLFANYRFNDQLKAGVYLANLTDEFDGTPTSMGYNFYPGRTLTANLEYRF